MRVAEDVRAHVDLIQQRATNSSGDERNKKRHRARANRGLNQPRAILWPRAEVPSYGPLAIVKVHVEE